MKTEITMKEAIDGVFGLFDILPWENREDEKSFYTVKEDGTASFFFDKRQYMRDEVIERLVNYFNDKVITDGQCRIDAMTLVWTTVHIEPRNNNQEN